MPATATSVNNRDKTSVVGDQTSAPIFADPSVEAVFNAYPPPQQSCIQALRALVFDVAAKTPGVGPLDETLKWGQPSYLTTASGSGSTLRMDAVKGSDHVALYVHCQTNLAETFRQHYDKDLTIEGKRAVLLDPSDPLPEGPLRHCIALALTYHLRKKP